MSDGIDFGLRSFLAPELLDFAPVSGGADMWSIGVLVFAL